MEDFKWCSEGGGRGGSYVDEKGCSREGFGPEGRWHGGLEAEGANYIIGGTDGTLGFAVLLRGVGT